MNNLSRYLIMSFAWLCGLIILGSLFTIIGYLLYNGLPSLSIKLIFDTTNPLDALFLKKAVFGGLFPSIFGTSILILTSVSIAIPIGLLTGIYLSEYAGKRTQLFFNLIYDILSGLPSIVIGLFGFSIAVFLHRHFSNKLYPCLLFSSLSLAILVLPYIIRTTQNTLSSLPENIRNTGLALGTTKLQNIIYVLLPLSLSGIFGGIILAIGRCAEDTAVIMLTGVAATAGIPRSFLSKYEALPFYIYYISGNYADSQELATGYGAAIILLLICTFFFFTSALIKNKIRYSILYRM